MMPHRSQLPKQETTDYSISARSLAAAHILWLRQRSELEKKPHDLARILDKEDMQLDTIEAFSVTSQQLANADLILLDAYNQLEGMVETIVARVRFESRVPLIMLTDGHSTEQLITALTAGADAIWSLNTPVEVLLARSKALLRRWLSTKNTPDIDQT